MSTENPIKLRIDGILDLHTFRPQDVKDLLPEYLEECRKQHISHVRIIHGKGTGTMRRIVHSLLEKSPYVLDYNTADMSGGGWGATEVRLIIDEDITKKSD